MFGIFMAYHSSFNNTEIIFAASMLGIFSLLRLLNKRFFFHFCVEPSTVLQRLILKKTLQQRLLPELVSTAPSSLGASGKILLSKAAEAYLNTDSRKTEVCRHLDLTLIFNLVKLLSQYAWILPKLQINIISICVAHT